MSDKVRKLIDDYKKHPELAIKQLTDCGYECEAGFLENNVAFIALKELVNEMQNKNQLEQPEYLVTFTKQVCSEIVEFKEIWNKKQLESKLAYATDLKIKDVKKL